MVPFMVPVPLPQWTHQAAMRGPPGFGNKDTHTRKNQRRYKKLINNIQKDFVIPDD